MTIFLEPGDILDRSNVFVPHPGIYWGNNLVLHNAPPRGEHLSSFEEWTDGHDFIVTKPTPELRREILRRSSEILANPQAYSHLWRNCEHTFYQITEGAPRSPTVRKAVGITVIVVAGGLAIKYRKEISKALRS